MVFLSAAGGDKKPVLTRSSLEISRATVSLYEGKRGRAGEFGSAAYPPKYWLTASLESRSIQPLHITSKFTRYVSAAGDGGKPVLPPEKSDSDFSSKKEPPHSVVAYPLQSS